MNDIRGILNMQEGAIDRGELEAKIEEQSLQGPWAEVQQMTSPR